MATQLFEHLIRFNKLGAKSRIGLCNSISLLFHVWCLQAQRWWNLFGIKFYTQITGRCEPKWIGLLQFVHRKWCFLSYIIWKGLQGKWHWALDCKKVFLISNCNHDAVKKRESKKIPPSFTPLTLLISCVIDVVNWAFKKALYRRMYAFWDHK